MITVLLFGHYRDVAPSLALEVPSGATVTDVAALLTARDPRFDGILTRTRAAVGADFVSADTPIRDGDELAFLPPMSGG